jgi:hypothetical protein
MVSLRYGRSTRRHRRGPGPPDPRPITPPTPRPRVIHVCTVAQGRLRRRSAMAQAPSSPHRSGRRYVSDQLRQRRKRQHGGAGGPGATGHALHLESGGHPRGTCARHAAYAGCGPRRAVRPPAQQRGSAGATGADSSRASARSQRVRASGGRLARRTQPVRSRAERRCLPRADARRARRKDRDRRQRSRPLAVSAPPERQTTPRAAWASGPRPRRRHPGARPEER